MASTEVECSNIRIVALTEIESCYGSNKVEVMKKSWKLAVISHLKRSMDISTMNANFDKKFREQWN